MDVQANDILKEVNKGKPIVETERWIHPRADQFQKGRAYFANRIYRVNSGSFSYRQFFRGVEWLIDWTKTYSQQSLLHYRQFVSYTYSSLLFIHFFTLSNTFDLRDLILESERLG